MRSRGFTIVELLIVIVVIAILAAITIVSYNGISERAKLTNTQSGQQQLLKAIILARTNTNKTLRQITGSNDSRNSKAAADAAIDAIAAASGANLAGLKNGDGWGNYYRIDENELELSASDCRLDSIQIYNQPSLTVYVPSSQPPCI
jgi:prepilin-type N-terminal cleavage/methylation domain-containing protein